MIGHILLLDVDLLLAEVFKRKLEDDGFKVTLGPGPDLKSKFDLVISGQPLGNQGYSNHGYDIPIITLSRDDRPNDTWQLKFPFRPSELLDLAHQRLALVNTHSTTIRAV